MKGPFTMLNLPSVANGGFGLASGDRGMGFLTAGVEAGMAFGRCSFGLGSRCFGDGSGRSRLLFAFAPTPATS